MALRIDYLTKETTRNFLRNPALTIGNVLTVAISLTLLGIALTVFWGTANLKAEAESEVSFVVWLKTEDNGVVLTDPELEQITQDLRAKMEANPFIKDLNYVDRDKTLSEVQRYFKDAPEIIALISPDVVPTSFVVTPSKPDISIVNQVKDSLSGAPGIDRISVATDVIKEETRIASYISWISGGFAVVAAFAATLLMYNSIRTAVFARRKEIEVMRLVGATKWFVRIPFMFEGLLQGVLGAVASGVSIFLVNFFINEMFTSIPKFSTFILNFGQETLIVIAMLLIGSLLGASAAGVAVSKYLDA